MPADILRITAAPGGAPVLDLADGNQFSYAPDSLEVDVGGQATGPGLLLDSGAGYITHADERYGGGVVDFDQRPNGILRWTSQALSLLPGGASINSLLAQLAAEVERPDPPRTRFVEWRRYGAAASLFYERRGPGTWNVTERDPAGEYALVDVALPVAPVAYGPPSVVALAQQTVPNVWNLPNPGGSLPALVDVQVQSATQLLWALLASYAGPFGVFEAEGAATISGGWAATADATARSASKLHVANPALNTNLIAAWNFDPSAVVLDALQYERDVVIEVWVRGAFAPVTASIIGTISAQTPDGAITVYSLEYGSTGKTLAQPRAGGGWALWRLGTLRIPPNPGNWKISVQLTVASAGVTSVDLDFGLLAPGRWRACSPTGVPSDSTYPLFAPNLNPYYKQVRADLSALGGTAAPPSHFDRGLAGSPLRCPVAAAPQLLIAASPSVPDDTSAAGVADAFNPVTPTVTLTPRYLLRDAS